jgi:hypothetical protein
MVPTNPTKQKNIMKKIIALFVGVLLAVPLAQAQTETGTSAGQQALDEARSGAISAGRTTTENVTVTDYKTASGKEVAVVEEEDKWWSINASTGWDSLYMYRGVNVLGNGNGIYWLSGGLGITPWENGSFNANVWYGVGSHWNSANTQQRYGELDVILSYTHTFFDALNATVGWTYYHYPSLRPADAALLNFNYPGNQNEIWFGLSYDIEVGSVTLTPNTTYYYNLGPQLGRGTGVVAGGSSYWQFGLSAEIPVARDGAISLAPYTQFGLNFGVNGRATANQPNNFNPFIGGNNWQTGLAMPIQLTSWFSISPYIAYSWQWQNLAGGGGTGPNGNGGPFAPGGVRTTAVNTWWGGISANFSF